jgi:hypothetical protein
MRGPRYWDGLAWRDYALGGHSLRKPQSRTGAILLRGLGVGAALGISSAVVSVRLLARM